jgi:hypothetical protein
MSGQAPSWTELLGRMAAVSFQTATGTVTYRETGTANGEVREGSADFWYRRDGCLRIEDADGLRLLQASGDTWMRTPEGG